MTTTTTTSPDQDNASSKSERAHEIIRKYALLGTATGLIPVFGIDVVAATAVQTKMVLDLSEVYGYDLEDQTYEVALSSGITALGGRVITGMITSLAKSFAPLESLVGSALSAAFAGFITSEIGQAYHTKMEAGHHPGKIKASDIVEHIIQQLRAGKFNPTSIKGQFSYLLDD